MNAKLTVVGSSSHGNGYLLQCGEESLILECGMSAKAVFNLLDWRIENVRGCLVTHRATRRPLKVYQSILEILSVLRLFLRRSRLALSASESAGAEETLRDRRIQDYGIVSTT